jgi:hypothetical protein
MSIADVRPVSGRCRVGQTLSGHADLGEIAEDRRVFLQRFNKMGTV